MVSVDKFMSEQEFNNSPLKNIMSYRDYYSNVLKRNSMFTFKHNLSLDNADNLSETIKKSVKGWALEKEKKKDEAEDEYYAALALYESMKKNEQKALKDLTYATNMYGEDSSWYSDALKKYSLSTKSLFNSDVNLSCARDKFNFANLSALKAYLISRS